MAYNANIPGPNDRLKDSQGPLLANFQEINTFLNENHVIFGSTGAGKHKFVTMPRQGADPNPTGTDIAVYSKLASGQTHLFWQKQNTAPGNNEVINMTEGSFIINGGWSRFPSGLIAKWAQVVVGSGGLQTLAAGAPITTLLSVQITPQYPAGGGDTFTALVDVQNPNPDSYRVFISARTTTSVPVSGGAFSVLLIGV